MTRLSRNLIRIWIQKFEVGAFNDEAAAADTIEAYEARHRCAGAVCWQTGSVIHPR